jgi:hypothetical protein
MVVKDKNQRVEKNHHLPVRRLEKEVFLVL